MATKPMLFNTEMVRAILSGQKTQTRRVVKGRARENLLVDYDGNCVGSFDFALGVEYPTIDDCRYHPGDILYVRETWNGVKTGNPKVGYHTTYWYKADDKDENPADKWRPSIHMPKEAARIFLRVTDVRVERLRPISDHDCMAEGITCEWNIDLPDAFAEVWDSTIKSADLDRYGWAANPWVWVIEFERISKEATLGGANL